MNMKQNWTASDREAAGMQGWLIAGGIERVDDMSVFCPKGDGEPLFVGDADARTFVECQALAGDHLALKAMEFVRQYEARLEVEEAAIDEIARKEVEHA